MLYSDFKNQTARRNVLAKVDVLGSFDFYTSLVSLDSLAAQDIQELHRAMHGELLGAIIERSAISLEQYQWAAKILPLAAHEYTHFIDTTSTLWGFQHLNLMNKAYLASDKNGAQESEFSNAKLFYDHSRRIRLPNYYTVVASGIENVFPWQSDMSIGYLFSSNGLPTDQPILFSRFSNYRGELLARSPISVVSLLEASAMAQELLLHSALIQLTDEDFRLVEQRQFAQRTLDYIYNPEITEYSVCAHIVANKQKCSDVLAAFRLCAIIVRTLLNLSKDAIQKVADTCPVAELMKLEKENAFVKAMHHGLRNGNLGILFYVICLALPERAYENSQAAIRGVGEALRTLGLDFSSIMLGAESRASEILDDLVGSTIQPISVLANAGYDNFKKIRYSDFELNFSNLNFPPALLSDSSVVHIFGPDNNLLKDFDFESCFTQLSAGQSWVERFAEACV